MLNHSHPSLPEMRLTPVPQDLTKRTTVVEEFSPQPKVIMMIHSDNHEYGLDVSELSDDDIDEISKLIGFAMKMKSVDDLRLFIAEHQSLQLIDEAVHLLYSQIGKADTQASMQVPEEYRFPKPMSLKEYGILDGTIDPEKTEMPTFLQTHFPSNNTPIGFSIEPYLMENYRINEHSTHTSISVGLRNLTDNIFQSIAGKTLDELVYDHTITAMEHGALLMQRDTVLRYFLRQLEEFQKATVTQETKKPSLSCAYPSDDSPTEFTIVGLVVVGALRNKALGFEASVEKAVGEIISEVSLDGTQEESAELTRQVLFAKSILKSDMYKTNYPELLEKKDGRSWYQRQNKIVKTVFAGACVGVMALVLYRKFGNKAD